MFQLNMLHKGMPDTILLIAYSYRFHEHHDILYNLPLRTVHVDYHSGCYTSQGFEQNYIFFCDVCYEKAYGWIDFEREELKKLMQQKQITNLPMKI